MANIIATRCAICGRSLRDPLSIEIGIGPECRRGKGFEVADAKADWGRALLALGNDCPADLYEVVVDAHGVRKGHDDGEVDTTLADAAKAIRGIGTGDSRRPGLCWYLATALDRDVSRQGVLRIVLAINELGYTKLASALARGLYTRKDFLKKYGACVAHIAKAEDLPVYTKRDGTSIVAGWRIEMSYNIDANNNLRALGAVFVVEKKSRKKFWAVPSTVTPRALFEAFWHAKGMDLVAGEKGVTTPRKFENPIPQDRVWWDEPCREEDRMCWVSSEHGELVRYAIPGEPPARPGMEKVPSDFFFGKLTKGVA